MTIKAREILAIKLHRCALQLLKKPKPKKVSVNLTASIGFLLETNEDETCDDEQTF